MVYNAKFKYTITGIRLDVDGETSNENKMHLFNLLEGKCTIGKIEPQTIKETLKQQNFGYLINLDSTITRVESPTETYEEWLIHIFPTKRKAEQEVHRRDLEYEMKEWARLRGWLGDFCLNPYELVFKGLNVYVKPEFVQEARSTFGGQYDTLVNWGL